MSDLLKHERTTYISAAHAGIRDAGEEANSRCD